MSADDSLPGAAAFDDELRTRRPQPDPYERRQFLIDRGIDLTIKDYRWGSTAAGWARHALRDEKMAQWLEPNG
jgi:hypothetical protein